MPTKPKPKPEPKPRRLALWVLRNTNPANYRRVVIRAASDLDARTLAAVTLLEREWLNYSKTTCTRLSEIGEPEVLWVPHD